MAFQKNYIYIVQPSASEAPKTSEYVNAYGGWGVIRDDGDFRGYGDHPYSNVSLNVFSQGYLGLYYNQRLQSVVTFDKAQLAPVITSSPLPQSLAKYFVKRDMVTISKKIWNLRDSLSYATSFSDSFTGPLYLVIDGARVKAVAIKWEKGILSYKKETGYGSSETLSVVDIPKGSRIAVELSDEKYNPDFYNFLEANELFKGITYGTTKAYNAETNAWLDPAYKDIKITNTSGLTNRDEFAAWLKANATQQ